MNDNRNRHRDLKRRAEKIYLKMAKFLTVTELEHFDVCKDFINELIYEEEAKRDKREMEFKQLLKDQQRIA